MRDVLGVSSLKRTKLLPDMPAMAETIPGYDVSSWYAVLAPAGTPRAIVEKLNADIVRVLNMPDVRERLAAMGSTPVGGTPEQFGDYVKREIERWGRVIRESGIKVD